MKSRSPGIIAGVIAGVIIIVLFILLGPRGCGETVVTPTPSPAVTPSATATQLPAPTASPTLTATATPRPTETAVPTLPAPTETPVSPTATTSPPAATATIQPTETAVPDLGVHVIERGDTYWVQAILWYGDPYCWPTLQVRNSWDRFLLPIGGRMEIPGACETR